MLRYFKVVDLLRSKIFCRHNRVTPVQGVTFMTFNQNLCMPHLSGGWINGSLTQILTDKQKCSYFVECIFPHSCTTVCPREKKNTDAENWDYIPSRNICEHNRKPAEQHLLYWCWWCFGFSESHRLFQWTNMWCPWRPVCNMSHVEQMFTYTRLSA